MSRLALLATWMVLLLGLAAPARTEDYAVQLDGPGAVVGEQYVVAGWTREVTIATYTSGQQSKREEKSWRVDFELGVKVLEVGASRGAHRAVLTVRRLTREADGATEELFAAGTTIDARLDGGKPVFTVGGKVVEGDAVSALLGAAGLAPDGWPTNDEVFGSRQRRGIGESWPIHSGAAARLIGKVLTADPQGVEGSVTLAAKRRVGDIPCLEYREMLKIPRMPQLMGPPGFKDTLNAVTSVTSVLLPLDPSLPEMEEDLTTTTHGRIEGTRDGAAATVEVRMRSELHTERKAPPAVPVH